MISTTLEERHWLLRNLAQGLIEYMSVTRPPVPVEEMLKHPPSIYERDFGVVDMYSSIWDATFARPPNRRGSIFVCIDIKPDKRHYALARETLTALITSEHGRRMGLCELFAPFILESADYFARQLLAPDSMVKAYRMQNGNQENFGQEFQLPARAAKKRWNEDGASAA